MGPVREAQGGRTRAVEPVAWLGSRETGPPCAVVRTRSYSLARWGRFWWWTALWCCVGASMAAPEWVPTAWTHEDGPVEYLGFGCFLIGSTLAFVASFRSRPARRWVLGCAR